MKRIHVVGAGNAFYSNGQGHSSFLLEDEEEYSVLLDAGATSLLGLKKLGFDSKRLDLILITHFHADHLAGIPFLLLDREKVDRHRLLKIAGPPGIHDAMESWMKLAYPGHEFLINLDILEIKAGVTSIDTVTIEAIPMNHRPESLGYIVKGKNGMSCGFSGDASLDENLLKLVSGSHVSIIEASLRSENPSSQSGHVTLEGILKQPEIRDNHRVYFTHLGEDVYSEMIDRFGHRVLQDGQLIDIENV